MGAWLLAVALTLALSLAASAPSALAVAGGTPAEPRDWSFAVALLDSRQPDPGAAQFCGGVLVRSDWVLTAAHCLEQDGRILEPSELEVAAGAVRLSALQTADRIPVDRVVPYPLRSVAGSAARGYDLALVHLARPAPGPTVATARIRGTGAIHAEAALAGWGVTLADTLAASERLRAGRVSVIGAARCRALGGAWDTICATRPGSREPAACAGDSGGPLTALGAGGMVIGLVSTGAGRCARGGTAAFTDLRIYAGWIARVARGGDPSVGLSAAQAMRRRAQGASLPVH